MIMSIYAIINDAAGERFDGFHAQPRHALNVVTAPPRLRSSQRRARCAAPDARAAIATARAARAHKSARKSAAAALLCYSSMRMHRKCTMMPLPCAGAPPPRCRGAPIANSFCLRNMPRHLHGLMTIYTYLRKRCFDGGAQQQKPAAKTRKNEKDFY